MADVIKLWRRRARSRHELAWLEDRLLHDIGVRADDALIESRKPFWRA